MKTKLFTLFTALLFSQAMMAQFHLGVKGGANMTKVQGKSFKDEFKYGYHLGGFAEVRLGNKFVLQPEVLFNQYSTTVDSSFKHVYQNVFNPAYQSNVKLNYLSIPLVLNYKLIGSFLSLQAGPQFGVLISKNKTLLQNGGEAFKHGDFSMLAGAQIKIGSIRLNGRYVIGLNNINDIDNQDQWKSQGFQLSVGLAL
ncbi:MAG: PorT family protein [Chitinophagaceae bacterium]|nr:PorT family protein [Chitinophagaceae bacterium]MBL0130790.1 PorT family protein [Chitinophagaceae bacterium]MBL0272891.1 PorT family protein [Chitinophagaceae bacterium]